VAPFLATFRDFPPRQKAASFTIDQAITKMEQAASGAPLRPRFAGDDGSRSGARTGNLRRYGAPPEPRKSRSRTWSGLRATLRS
jgi:hypothetical protein